MARVLVVEDEAVLLVLSTSILEDNGYETLTASTIAEALALIQANDRIDLLFTDINLVQDAEAGLVHPGLELAQQAVKLRPGLPVLYTTGQNVTDGMRALFVEGSGFLAKPYTVQDLAAKVAEMVPSREA